MSRIQHLTNSFSFIHSFIHRNVIDPIIHSSRCGWETIRIDQWGGFPSNTLSSKKHLFIYFYYNRIKIRTWRRRRGTFGPLLSAADTSKCLRNHDGNNQHTSQILFARHSFRGFVRGFSQKYIWLRWDLCLLTFFFCLFVPGFDRNIWHQIMGFLFARKFLLRIV